VRGRVAWARSFLQMSTPLIPDITRRADRGRILMCEHLGHASVLFSQSGKPEKARHDGSSSPTMRIIRRTPGLVEQVAIEVSKRWRMAVRLWPHWNGRHPPALAIRTG